MEILRNMKITLYKNRFDIQTYKIQSEISIMSGKLKKVLNLPFNLTWISLAKPTVNTSLLWI